MARLAAAIALAVALTAVSLLTPFYVSRRPPALSPGVCIKSRSVLEALLVEYNTSATAARSAFAIATGPLARSAVAHGEAAIPAAQALSTTMAEKYWRSLARFLLAVYESYYAAWRYYVCTGDAQGAARAFISAVTGKPASKASRSLVADVARFIERLNGTTLWQRIEALKEALTTNNPTKVSDYLRNAAFQLLVYEMILAARHNAGSGG